MKIEKIKMHNSYNRQLEKNVLTVSIDFNIGNINDITDGDALYYLICAMENCNGKSHKDLNTTEKNEVLSKLDSTIIKLQQIRKEIK